MVRCGQNPEPLRAAISHVERLLCQAVCLHLVPSSRPFLEMRKPRLGGRLCFGQSCTALERPSGPRMQTFSGSHALQSPAGWGLGRFGAGRPLPARDCPETTVRGRRASAGRARVSGRRPSAWGAPLGRLWVGRSGGRRAWGLYIAPRLSYLWPEKAMAPHSSTLAWKIPRTEEPGRLQSMGSLESDTTERLHFHFSLSCIGEGLGNPLQCSCLENPGALPSMGSHRVGHD